MQPTGKNTAILIDATRRHWSFWGTPVSARDIGEQQHERCHLPLECAWMQMESHLVYPSSDSCYFYIQICLLSEGKYSVNFFFTKFQAMYREMWHFDDMSTITSWSYCMLLWKYLLNVKRNVKNCLRPCPVRNLL